jgi:pseudouridylate synthase / pseudouridine kinase
VLARGRNETVILKHYPSLPVADDAIVNVTGAGDSLVGSILASLSDNPRAFEHPQQLDRVIRQAQSAAILTLQSSLAVSPQLSNLPIGL